MREGYFSEYSMLENHFDEVFSAKHKTRQHYKKVHDIFNKLKASEFKRIIEFTKASFFNQGITFAVYSDSIKGVERIFPFDLFPRIIPSNEWDKVEKGLVQRNTALNLFLADLYNEKRILKEKVIPAELIFSSNFYIREMNNFTPNGGIYNHISGTDLIKHSDGEYYVLEDNIRCPSGVSYVLSNREAMKRILSNLFYSHNIEPIMEYPEQLHEILKSVAPDGREDPTCVLLTPGVFNSAYYEHSFLAQSMGIPLVEGRDLFVDKNYVYMKTIYGPKRVDVVYRRIDDHYIDPFVFSPDSLLGVPGLFGAYRQGNVTLLNAPGTGVADDKAVYQFMPQIIKFYLSEEPILKNVHTYRCELDDDYKFVMDNIKELVVKPVDESGGYGIFIGPRSTKTEQEEFKRLVSHNRRRYIAQPVMALSLHSTYIEGSGIFEPRHIDLRTFFLMGKNKHYVLKGGLSRVALKKGSLIVNSSQGGGSKDTWVLKK